MRRFLGGKQALEPNEVPSDYGDEKASRSLGNLPPRKAKKDASKQERRGSAHDLARGKAVKASAFPQSMRGYPSYAEPQQEYLQHNQHDHFSEYDQAYSRGQGSDSTLARRMQQQGHLQDSPWASDPASRGGFGSYSGFSSQSPLAAPNDISPRDGVPQAGWMSNPASSLSRKGSRSQRTSSGLGGIFHRHQERPKSSALPRRRSSIGSAQTEEDLYPQESVRMPPQRHMSLNYGRTGMPGMTRDVGRGHHTLSEDPTEMLPGDGDYDASTPSGRRDGTHDKMRRLVFGKRRAEGPKSAKNPKLLLESDGESSDDGRRSRAKRQSGGVVREESWEHVPSADSSSQNMNDSSLSFDAGGRNAETKAKHGGLFRHRANKEAPIKAPPRDKVKAVGEEIHLFCNTEESVWEREQVEQLCATIAHSDSAAKDAAAALRKELRSKDDKQLMRAVKLWACFYVFSSDLFKAQVASKKFVETLEDLYRSQHTSSRTQGRLLVAWGMIARDASKTPSLQLITKAFNKAKPSDMPINGMPLDYDHDVFQIGDSTLMQGISNGDLSAPTEVDERSRYRQPYPQQDHNMLSPHSAGAPPMMQSLSNGSSGYSSQATSASGGYYPSAARDNAPPVSSMALQSQRHPESDYQKAIELHEREHEEQRRRVEQQRRDEEFANLHRACDVARSNAQVLSESIADDGVGGDIVFEFADKVRASQGFIGSRMSWVSRQVEEGRQRRVAMQSLEDPSRPTAEEQLMADFLDAHERLATSISMLEEAEQKRREDEEEAQILERSMREMRMDRSTLVRDPETGALYNVNDLPPHLANERQGNALAPPQQPVAASGSRGPSPTPASRRPLPEPRTAASNHAAGGPRPLSSAGTAGQARPVPQPPAQATRDSGGSGKLDGSLHGALPRPPRSNINTTGANDRNSQGSTTNDDITTPLQPSEKALGKRRAMSIYDPNNAAADTDGAASHALHTTSSGGSEDESKLRLRPPPALPQL